MVLRNEIKLDIYIMRCYTTKETKEFLNAFLIKEVYIMTKFFEVLRQKKKAMIIRGILVFLLWRLWGTPVNAFVVFLGYIIWDMVEWDDYKNIGEKIVCIIQAIGCVIITVVAGVELKYALYISAMMLVFSTIWYLVLRYLKKRFD